MAGRHPGGCRVAPFGNPRIKDRMRLPVAYRSLPRPSSPAAAKASAMRPYSLGAKSMAPGAGGPGEPGRFCPCFRGAHSVGAPRGSVASWKSVFTFRARPLLSGARARGRLPKRPPGGRPRGLRAAPGMTEGSDGGCPSVENGGAEGTRTHDILLAKQALYQLSYGPSLKSRGKGRDFSPHRKEEPPRKVGAVLRNPIPAGNLLLPCPGASPGTGQRNATCLTWRASADGGGSPPRRAGACSLERR